MNAAGSHHPLALAFFGLYHAGEYWEAHEVLEELWQTQRGNDFYHGLIQVAAIMHQLERGKVRGARKLAATAVGYLTPFAPAREGVDVARIIRWLKRCLQVLPKGPVRIEPAQVETFGLGVCPLPRPEEESAFG